MLRSRITILTITGLMIVSCATIKDNSVRQFATLEKGDYEKLNGQFSNYPTTAEGIIERDMNAKDFEPKTLWSQLVGFAEAGDKEIFEKQIVKLWIDGDLKKQKS